MGSRFRKPQEHRLELDGGDWLLVKKYLTAGDERDLYARMYVDGSITPGEKLRLDPVKVGLSQILAYLLDWSITDADDQPIRIRDQSPDFLIAALNDMDGDSFREILSAIQAHDGAMTAEREHEKKTRAGGTASSLTSTSVG